MFGFLACVTGTFCRGLKSVMQAVLLSSESEKMSSINLLMYMSPVATIILIFVAAIVEPTGIWDTIALMRESTFFCFVLVINCVLAYCLNLLNFLVTRYTSALTLQVLGNGKEVVAAAVSIMIFKNPVTLMGILGYVITMGGVVAYSESKKRSKSRNVLAQKEGESIIIVNHQSKV